LLALVTPLSGESSEIVLKGKWKDISLKLGKWGVLKFCVRMFCAYLLSDHSRLCDNTCCEFVRRLSSVDCRSIILAQLDGH